MIDRTANYATISRPASGTATLTPLTGTLVVDSTDDEAVAALVEDSGSDTAAALAASYVGQPSSTPTDGQLLGWDDTAEEPEWVSPTGTSELAYGDNTGSAAQTGLSTTQTDISGCSITVPISARPVYIGGAVTVQATSGASASQYVVVVLEEVSNGVDTPITSYAFGLPLTGTNVVSTIPIPGFRLWASTARTRTLKLSILSSGVVFKTQVHAAALNGFAFLAAEAR